MSAEELPNGLLYGKLPGKKKWSLFYVEAVENIVHIYEGSADPTRGKGRQLRTLVISPSDWAGEEKSRKKNRYKFFVRRPDGKYLFRCDSPEEQQDWLAYLQQMITGKDDHPEDDSNGGDTNDGDTSGTQQLEGYLWFWGWMSREYCEKKLRTEGEVGHFVVRINAMGEYVMSFWYPSGIFHHKIIHDGNLFRFERSTVPAEGASLADLLRTFMGHYSGKIVPFGGSLMKLRPKDDGWRHQIHQQLASEVVPIAPTPPTRRYRYNPVHLDGFATNEKQPSPAVLNEEPILAPPSTRKLFGFEHMQVQKSASLDEMHLQLRKRDLKNVHARPPEEIPQDFLLGRSGEKESPVVKLTPLNDWPIPASTREQFSNKHADVHKTQSLDQLHTQERMKNLGHIHVRTRPLPPRYHFGKSDEHHYANKSVIDQTQQLRQQEQWKQETPQQQWNELQQPAPDHEQNWDSDYQNNAMIHLHQKLGRR